MNHETFLLVSARIVENETAILYGKWTARLDEQSNMEALAIRKLRERFRESGVGEAK